MRPLKKLAAALTWVLATVLAIVAILLCVTIILLPLGIPLLGVAMRMYGAGVRMMLPANPLPSADDMKSGARRSWKRFRKQAPDPLPKGLRKRGSALAGNARKRLGR